MNALAFKYTQTLDDFVSPLPFLIILMPVVQQFPTTYQQQMRKDGNCEVRIDKRINIIGEK